MMLMSKKVKLRYRRYPREYYCTFSGCVCLGISVLLFLFMLFESIFLDTDLFFPWLKFTDAVIAAVGIMVLLIGLDMVLEKIYNEKGSNNS